MTKQYQPTQAIRNNSERGIALLEKAGSLSSQAAKDKVKKYTELLKQQSVDLEAIKELYVYLTKQESRYQPNKRLEGNNVDSDTASFLAAGGTSALAWCRMLLKEAEIVKSYTKEIKQQETEKEDELAGLKLPVVKAVNSELKQVTYIAMTEGVDAHGDSTSLEEIRKAKESFNRALTKQANLANLFHVASTNTFEIIESYLAPVDMVINERVVKAGTWLMTLQVLDDGLWDLIKSENIVGLSIGALANVEELEKDEDD